MSDSRRTFQINSPQEAEVFGDFVYRYCTEELKLNGKNSSRHWGKLYSYAARVSDLNLFYAVMDLELTYAFVLKDVMYTGEHWNNLHSTGMTSVESVLQDFSTFAGKMEILNGFTSLSYRCRAWWDKYMGVLIMIHERNKYEEYINSKSRQKAFQNIASKWPEISPHIQQGFTTTYRNLLIHLEKSPILKDDQRNHVRTVIDYYEDNVLEFPGDMPKVMISQINSLNTIRTAEAHGTGILRKWSFSMLPISESRDFALANNYNDVNICMHSLRDMLNELINS